MRKHHVALSFAGEQREFVERVGNCLKAEKIDVYYDRHDQSNSWGENLKDYFGKIYREEAYLIVLFVSKDYVKKEIPRHEAKNAMTNPNNIVLVAKFDDSRLDGEDESKIFMEIEEGTAPQSLSGKIKDVLVRRGIVFGEESQENSFVEERENVLDSSIEISILSHENIPTPYSSVYPIRREIPQEKPSISEGVFKFSPPVKKDVYSFYFADKNHSGVYIKNVSVGERVKVKLNLRKNVGSIAGCKHIEIPNFNFKINPIIDSLSRKYFYLKNGICKGKEGKPYYFEFRENLTLENFSGEVTQVRILHGIKAPLFLVEYIKT